MAATFHNVQPRTREERAAAHVKDAKEKNMLKARTGGHFKYETPGNPLIPEPHSPMYANEADRFNRDVAGDMQQKKQEELQKRQVRI